MTKRVRENSLTIIFRDDADVTAEQLLFFEVDRTNELMLIDSAITQRGSLVNGLNFAQVTINHRVLVPLPLASGAPSLSTSSTRSAALGLVALSIAANHFKLPVMWHRMLRFRHPPADVATAAAASQGDLSEASDTDESHLEDGYIVFAYRKRPAIRVETSCSAESDDASSTRPSTNDSSSRRTSLLTGASDESSDTAGRGGVRSISIYVTISVKLGSPVYKVGGTAEVESMQDSRDLVTEVSDVMTTGSGARRHIMSNDRVLNDMAVAVHLASGATVASALFFRKSRQSKGASPLSSSKFSELKFLPDLVNGHPAVEVHLAGVASGSSADVPMTEIQLRAYSWGSTADDPRLQPSAFLHPKPNKPPKGESGAGARKNQNEQTLKRAASVKLALEVIGSTAFMSEFEWPYGPRSVNTEVLARWIVSVWDETDHVIYGEDGSAVLDPTKGSAIPDIAKFESATKMPNSVFKNAVIPKKKTASGALPGPALSAMEVEKVGMFRAIAARLSGSAGLSAGGATQGEGGAGHTVWIMQRNEQIISMPLSYDIDNPNAETSVLRALIDGLSSTYGGSNLLERPQANEELMLRFQTTGADTVEGSLRTYSFLQLKQVKVIDLLKDGNLKKPLHGQIYVRDKVAQILASQVVSFDDF
jgi:hypothetical protein